MSFQLLSEHTRVARTQHRCIWCGESIVPGERYRDERSVYDGSMQKHRWHLECDEAGAVHFSEGDSEFSPHENDRPPSAGALEYASWDCADLFQRRLH